MVRLFFTGDLLLAALYVADSATGRPSGGLADLAREGNPPTFFASAQLLWVGGLLAFFAMARFDRARTSSWLLWCLPLLFLALGLDEILQVHEYLGRKIDEVPGASRSESIFHVTGFWMFAVGGPFVAIVVSSTYLLREYLRVPGVLAKAAVGFGIFMGGAIGIETLSNFVERPSLAWRLEVLAEESCELIGVTLMLWAAHDLLQQALADNPEAGTTLVGRLLGRALRIDHIRLLRQ